jgi:hypothetical protein
LLTLTGYWQIVVGACAAEGCWFQSAGYSRQSGDSAIAETLCFKCAGQFDATTAKWLAA